MSMRVGEGCMVDILSLIWKVNPHCIMWIISREE
jgi:hypothetical protein